MSAAGAAVSLGAFDLFEPVGRGGMGEVWRGVHRAEQLPVAVKVVRAKLADQAASRALFRHEVRAVAGLDHDNVVMLFDHGAVDEEAAERSGGRLAAHSPYLVMEWASGGTLADHAPMNNWGDVREALLSILAALGHAHARGVVHRDLKLQNVVSCTGADLRPGLKLADFGIAQHYDDLPDETLSAGTRGYMAPEQAAHLWRDQGPWTDLYSLGVLAWKLSANPVAGVASASTTERRIPAGFPNGFDEWLGRLLEPDPAERFHRATEAAEALRSLRGTMPARRSSAPPRRFVSRPPEQVTSDQETGPTATLATALEDTSAHLISYSAIADGLRAQPGAPAIVAWPELADAQLTAARMPARLRLPGAGLGLLGLRPVPFVGRAPERERLWDALSDVASGRGPRGLVLTGAVGTGKRRLARWLGEEAHERGLATVLHATQAQLGGAADGLVPMLARHLGCTKVGVIGAGRRIAELFGLDLDDPDQGAEAGALGELLVRDHLAGAERRGLVRGALRRLAVGRPLVLIVEDAQWGADTLSIVAELLHTEVPMLFVLTVREDALATRSVEQGQLDALVNHGAMARIEVGPLRPEHRAALVQKILGLSPELAARVEERAAGNPLYALRLVADWAEQGLLEVTPRGFELSPGARATAPHDLGEVWREVTARTLAQWPDEQRAAVELAATLGSDVDRAEWEAACKHAGLEASDAGIEALFERGLAHDDGHAFSFSSSMLREALLERAEEEGRSAAHHRAAAAAITGAGEARGSAPGQAERIGRHLLAAGDVAEALVPLLLAAEARLAGGEAGRAEALVADLEHALDAAEDSGLQKSVRARLAILHAGACRLEARYDDADMWLSRVEQLTSDDDHAERARANATRGAVHRERGQREAMLSAYEAALSEAELAGAPAIAASCARWVGIGHLDAGEPDLATPFLERSLRTALASADELGAARARLTLGVAARLSGRPEEARAHLERAVEGMQTAGARGGLADCLNALGELERTLGSPGRAAERYLRAAALHESLGSRSAAVARLNLGLALIDDGRPEEARPVLRACRATFERQGRRGLVAGARVALLECAASVADWVDWDVQLRGARDRLEETGFADVDLAKSTLRAAARALESGERTRAADAFDIARSQWLALGRAEDAEAAEADASAARENE